MDDDLQAAVDFAKRIKDIADREILCENTGLAFEIKKLGCKVILGPNCNIYNSWNVLEYSETLNPYGIVPSLELAPEVIEKMQFPEPLQVWYPKKLRPLLMQSRQCLVRNASGCNKSHVDRSCVENCAKKVLLTGTQEEKIIAAKRPGFYSALFAANQLEYSCSKNFAEKVSVWIIDKRTWF